MTKDMEDPSGLEDGMLTKLFRKIIFDTGLVNSLGYFLNRYNRKIGKKNKASIVKIINSKGMSWKSFVFLIFEVLQVRKMNIKITLTHLSGEVTEHDMDFIPPKQIDKESKNEPTKSKRN